MKIFSLIMILLSVTQLPVFGQCDGKPGPDGLTWNFDEKEKEGFHLFRFLGGLFTPDLIKETQQIRSYVRDPRFALLVRRCGDMQATDYIYLRALRICDHNVARALFLSMMATIDHRDVDVKVPVLGSLGLPLTLEDDSVFKARYANLPARLYGDTPPEGDKDKLQHFFGSAYIAYASESRELASTSGDLVEWGEAKFIVGGVDDPRDRRANSQGARFGRDLLSVKNSLPSDFLDLNIQE